MSKPLGHIRLQQVMKNSVHAIEHITKAASEIQDRKVETAESQKDAPTQEQK